MLLSVVNLGLGMLSIFATSGVEPLTACFRLLGRDDSMGRPCAQNNVCLDRWSFKLHYEQGTMLMGQVTQEDAKALDERWSREMDEVLREGVLRYGAGWDLVAGHMAPRACSQEEVEKR